MKILHLILISAIFYSNLSCRKKHELLDDTGLPTATMTGRNIFACKINGEPWISERGSEMVGSVRNDTLAVRGEMKTSTTLEVIQLALLGTFSPTQTNYPLIDTSKSYAHYIKFGAKDCFDSAQSYGDYVSLKIANGFVTISKADNGIVAGTFEFSVPTDKCDTLKITDGRFDLRYY
jgi:hypothetical protein